MSAEFLRRLPLFAGLSDADLSWLVAQAEPLTIRAGEVLIEEGSPGDTLFVLLGGEFQVSKRSGAAEVPLAVRGRGEVIGEMSLLDRAPRSATVRALQEGQVLVIRQETFARLLMTSPTAALTMLHTVTARLRENEALLRQREKMAALGTLAAGLAHELNNPAAAARRSSAQLREALAQWERASGALNASSLGPPQVEKLMALQRAMAERMSRPPLLDTLARSDREAEMQAWLEARGVDRAWELAPTLVGVGWDVRSLEAAVEGFAPDQLPVIIPWLGAGGTVRALLDEMAASAERIAEIVKAVKSYTFLDQAPIQDVDVHEGLENTLVMLRHKWKEGITVARDYAQAMPRIEAYGSELNQVWTNLVDNAVDAMGGWGELTLRTRVEGDRVVVEVQDTGPGIPPEVQARIFEPFFTTKPPGVGTGLGLHIAYHIVQRHAGRIEVTAQPGATCFRVTLPTRLKRG
jgi:signal transduction histidine kinase